MYYLKIHSFLKHQIKITDVKFETAFNLRNQQFKFIYTYRSSAYKSIFYIKLTQEF
jgi:hypothetical protein